ncbi:sulfatase-like hydrolase/transferase [Horticoccus sp. 23ND18S-11]|uniref:sulfatase-like hydrolase/transferase n=1 Tax=Horticoccus sp. 23ND18S-11 TaxID=3391832 RepID=UPI0039C9A783
MRHNLPSLVLAFAALVLSSVSIAAEPRPNIILVVVDDLRFDDFGAAGHPFARTAHLDRVAREGAQFKNFFAVTPLCSPSRANILTGLETRHHGILDNTERSPRSHALPTFARTLHAAGYHTGFIGKWHMGNDPTPRPGFDYWVAMKGQGEVTDPELFENGRLARAPGYVTDIFTQRAVRFIQQPRTAPFLLVLSHKALHPNKVQRADGTTEAIGEGGFIPAERHKTLYAGAQPPRRGNYAMPPKGKPALERPIAGVKPLGPDSVTPDETIRDRLRMLAAVDEGLGQILAELEKQGTLNQTVVMVIGDNGYFYGEHGLSEERRLAYEESIRLPLLVRYPPRVKAGTEPSGMALTTDLAPTILELAGAPALADIDGRSLLPLFTRTPADWRKSFLIEYTSDIVFPRMLKMGYDAVRTERYKYIRYRELKDMNELYDLQEDPFELSNLISSPPAAGVRQQMEAELNRILSSGRAQLH